MSQNHIASEWKIDEASYPHGGSPRDELRFLLNFAILAPSSHNSQPWLFRLKEDVVEVIADRTRALPVVDPYDRELLISCGAAIGLLRTAMRYFGTAGEIELLPDDPDADLVARISLGATHEPDASEQERFKAISLRRSTRIAFEDRPLPAGLDQELKSIASEDGVELAIMTDERTRLEIAALIAEADRAQYSNPSFRRELAAWIHSRRTSTRDGMSLASFGAPDWLSEPASAAIRMFNIGGKVAQNDQQIASGSPALVILATSGDTPREWLGTGMAHVGVLLAVAAAGLKSAYMNQPVEADDLRPRLQKASGIGGIPQLLLRIGFGPDVPPSVRRPVADVLIE